MGAFISWPIYTICGHPSSKAPASKAPAGVRSPTKAREKTPTLLGAVVVSPNHDESPISKSAAEFKSIHNDKATIDGIDHDTNLWHGREPASQLVRRWTLDSEQAMQAKGGSMGILEGVIFPCMANILGVLLFLRLPWIVGKAGILHGFFLVFICCCCTFLTTLSLSAVATNGKILGGGSYFLISRSLGPALGAGVGLCFYMANSIGAAMYFMGTVEAWEIAAPNVQIMTAGDLNNIRVTGFCILAVALVVVAGGIKYVARLGTVFLFIVLGVIACMYLGCLIGPGNGSGRYEVENTDVSGRTFQLELTWGSPSSEYFADNFGPAYDAEQQAFPLDTGKYDFISLMALWFPAVTGIMAGSNRSADLKDPAGSIPKGTLFAQGFTSLIYLSFVLLFGCVAPRSTLLDDKFFAASSAWPLKEIVLYGVMASTIGAGLTSLVSGTRLLSAIAADNTLPVLRIFAVNPGSEPRYALVASGVLCACAIAIGELNAVAPVLTMFFLMCYTCVNMSCTILEAVNDPNWRPRFRFHHWSISLMGAILCVWMMFAISAIIAMIAILFCSVIFVYAAYNSHEVKWGDGFQGMKFQLARNILTHMDLKTHTKNWRPQLLVITDASVREDDSEHGALNIHDPELLKFVSQLKGGHGITIVGGVCNTEGIDVFSEGGMFFGQQQEQRQMLFEGQDEMQSILRKYRIEGFGRMVYTRDPAEGFMSLVQIAGLGAFQPNCVLTSWPQEWNGQDKSSIAVRAQLICLVQMAVVFQKVMLIAKGFSWPDFAERVNGNIDIWWIVGDGGILLLLPFLLSKHRVWNQCRTRLWVLADKLADDQEMMMNELQTYVRDFRLKIEVHVKIIDDSLCNTFTPGEMQTIEPSNKNNSNIKYERQISGNSTLGEGISKWRHARNPSSGSTGSKIILQHARNPSSGSTGSKGIFHHARQPSSGSTGSKGILQKKISEPNGIPQRQMSAGSKSIQSLLRQNSSGSKTFPMNPPGTIGSQLNIVSCEENAQTFASCSAEPLAGTDVSKDACVDNGTNNNFHANAVSDPEPLRQFSSLSSHKQGSFMHNGSEQTSTKPLSKEQLDLARGLNAHIAAESINAELVVTNLPDMPPNESAFGYFQMVETMTQDLKRCLLVRGTAMEVITAFT